METDEQGILTEGALKNVAQVWVNQQGWVNQDFAESFIRTCWSHYDELMKEAAEAQHEHDVAVVREALIPVDLQDERYQRGAEAMQRAILAALKAKADVR